MGEAKDQIGEYIFAGGGKLEVYLNVLLIHGVICTPARVQSRVAGKKKANLGLRFDLHLLPRLGL